MSGLILVASLAHARYHAFAISKSTRPGWRTVTEPFLQLPEASLSFVDRISSDAAPEVEPSKLELEVLGSSVAPPASMKVSEVKAPLVDLSSTEPSATVHLDVFADDVPSPMPVQFCFQLEIDGSSYLQHNAAAVLRVRADALPKFQVLVEQFLGRPEVSLVLDATYADCSSVASPRTVRDRCKLGNFPTFWPKLFFAAQ